MATALILDTDADYARLLASSLESLGHKALLATTIEEAEDLIARKSVDGVIVEPQMPSGVYAGLDFIDELLFDGWPSHRILVLTALQMVELSRQCAELRVAMRLKPITLDQIERVLERWSQKKAARRTVDAG